MTWLSLSNSQSIDGTLRLRFVPDMFALEQEAPVIEVVIEEPEDPEHSLALLARFHSDFIVSLDIHPQELRVLGEMDDEETLVKGNRVSSRNVQYSADELLTIAQSFQLMLQEETAHAYRQSAKLNDITHFVTDLIDRAEKKRALSDKPSASMDAQLAVLSRVLNRLNDA